MDKLKDYLKNIDFKKRKVGGLDEEDVLQHIKKISELVTEELESRDSSDEEAIQKMKKELDDAQTKVKKYRTACAKLKEVNEGLEGRIQELQKNPPKNDVLPPEPAVHSQADYDRKYRELAAAISALNNVKKEEEREIRSKLRKMLEQEAADSRAEMRKRLEQDAARVRAGMKAKLEEEQRRLQEQMKEERRRYRAQLDGERRQAEDELAKLKAEIAGLERQKRSLEETAARKEETFGTEFGRYDAEKDLDDWGLLGDFDFGDLGYGKEEEESF